MSLALQRCTCRRPFQLTLRTVASTGAHRCVHNDTPVDNTTQKYMKDETHQADSLEDNAPKSHPLKPATTVAERDADYVEKLKEREGSLANTEFEDGKIEEGLRRNVKANIFRYI